jgi:hypothetical protein
MTLHEELAGSSAPACRICAYLATLTYAEADEWARELSKSIEVIANVAVVRALKRRGVELTEASVRRHRENHA